MFTTVCLLCTNYYNLCHGDAVKGFSTSGNVDYDCFMHNYNATTVFSALHLALQALKQLPPTSG